MIFYSLYRVFLWCLTPFLFLWIVLRRFKGKEDPVRWTERFGRTNIQRPTGPLFWFHGASNGECLSFLPLLTLYHKRYPNAHFLVTSQTRTSSDLLKSRLPTRSFHQFLPLDHPFFVRRFLGYWKPAIVFWTESELWPTCLFEAKKKCPLILLNGRISESAFKVWRKIPKTAKKLLDLFSLIFCQSPKDLERIFNLGGKKAQYLGNLKFGGTPLGADTKKLKSLQQWIKDRSIWTASCTHEGEEEIVLEAHRLLQKSIPNILLILVPRHPQRSQKIKELAESKGLKVFQRSNKTDSLQEQNILLFDSTGELGLVYRLAPITFIGGSLVRGIGGHNPLEAALLKSVILTGPFTENNQELYDLFLKEDACKNVTSPEDLAQAVLTLFDCSQMQEELISRSFSLASRQQNVLKEIMNAIDASGVLP